MKQLMRNATLFVVILVSFAFASEAKADIKYEFQAAQGYTDNLFANNIGKDDRNSIINSTISFYPDSKIKLNFKNGYTYYGRTVGLSNYAGSASIDYIPFDDSKKYSLYLNGNFNPTLYRDEYIKFNNNSFSFNAALGYAVNELLQLRLGTSIKKTDYTDEAESSTLDGFAVYAISGDQTEYEFFTGFNYTLLDKIALDFETGYSSMNLSFVSQPTSTYLSPITFERIPHDYLIPGQHPLEDGTMKSFYFSPRLSTSIGSKFGINLTYIYRDFQDVDSMIIPGLSTDAFSPWASVYEGHAVTGTIKTFIVPNFIISAGAGYWDKDFLKSEKTREVRVTGSSPTEIDDRQDEQTKFYFAIKRPFPSKMGLYFEPAIQIDIVDNSSTNVLYEYESISVNAGLTVRF